MSVDDFAQHDRHLFGDTLNTKLQNKTKVSETSVETITLDKFSQLLETKLEEKLDRHKQSILTDIKTAFRSEISQAISTLKQEIKQNTDALHTEQTHIKEDISNICSKIKTLETERDHLKIEIQKILKKSQTPMQKERDENKTIVIYGLQEYHNEYETNLERRVINAFMHIMEIDITGYIEEIHRIGKSGSRRPVKMELISKRMTKYILNNARQFRSTGLYVSGFLDQKSLQDRRNQHEKKHSLVQAEPKHADNLRPSTSRQSEYEYEEPSHGGHQTSTQIVVPAQTSRQTKPNNTQSIGGTFRF